MSQVRIFYREADDSVSQRIFQEMVSIFGARSVFKETTQTLGRTRFNNGDVALVVVGGSWGKDQDLHNPDNFLRRIAEALLNKKVSVIPVLVDDAVLPKPEELPREVQEISRKSPVTLRSGPQLDEDINRLKQHVLMHRSSSGRQLPAGCIVRVAIVVVILGVIGGLLARFRSSPAFNNLVDILDPTRSAIYVKQGWASYAAGNFQDARNNFERAVKLNMRGLDAHSGLAWSSYQLGDYETAISNFSRVIELNPRRATGFFERGWYYYLQKDYTSATDDFVMARQLDPKLASSYLGLGSVGDAQDQYEKALRYLQRYVALVKEPDAGVLKRIEQLKYFVSQPQPTSPP